MKTNTLLLIVVLLLTYFAALPRAQSVSPAPDGGYPAFTTAEGTSALKNLSTGSANTAVGWLSLFTTTVGSYNTAIGAGTLALNTADQNTAIGAGALLGNTTGSSNTASGFSALLGNTTGISNTANGAGALQSNTTGDGNTAVGVAALFGNIVGNGNTGIGGAALAGNTGDNNTATGFRTLMSNTGNLNTGTGFTTLENNTTGAANAGFGAGALGNNFDGNANTAVGNGALFGNMSGNFNVAVGNAAGFNLTSGDNNIDIGYNVQGVAGESNTVRIGNQNITSTYIRGISGQTIATGAAVLVIADGQLGTMTSSARFKEGIKPMDKVSEALFSLKPVTFRYKKDIDPRATPQLGLVAEDVEKVDPYLVVRDKQGKPYSVRYDQVNAMLLNEFIKEHKAFLEEQRKVQGLEANAVRQQKQIAALTAGLQKLSTHLELTKSAPDTVLNDREKRWQ